MSNNTVKTVFSTQDIVSCSEYSQGCEGGFPYLIGGRYSSTNLGQSRRVLVFIAYAKLTSYNTHADTCPAGLEM